MKYVDEFRDKKLVARLSGKIKAIAPAKEINIMEVCGTHTHNFFRFGLDKLLPPGIKLISGPGCPVCVSTHHYIDKAILLAARKDVIIATFGDMLCVPGSSSSLEKQRAKTANVRVVYSALDSLKIAKSNPDKKIVFLAVGFETTIPTIALSILTAKKQKSKNLFFLVALKLIPPAMGHLARDKRLNLQGFLCPGHVSAVIGAGAYWPLAKRYNLTCCIAGFEPLDILEGIYFLLQGIKKVRPQIINQYTRVVTESGNNKAKEIMHKVFKASDADWRGLGRIPKSGLKLKDEFFQFDAERLLRPTSHVPRPTLMNKCRCGDILKGLLSPPQCPLFSKRCRPDNPLGPCMVSNEGACNAYYKYHR